MALTEHVERITITLPPAMLASIKEKTKSGAYSSTSEVIREAVRCWQHKEEEYQAKLALIRARLERSAQSGTAVPLDKAFAQIEQLHQHRMTARGDD